VSVWLFTVNDTELIGSFYSKMVHLTVFKCKNTLKCSLYIVEGLAVNQLTGYNCSNLQYFTVKITILFTVCFLPTPAYYCGLFLCPFPK